MKRSYLFHPLLFGLASFLSLFAENLDQMRPAAGLRAGIVTLLFCLLACAGLRLALRSWSRAALVASLWFVFFYTYGHAYELLEGRSLLGLAVGKHRYLFPLWAILALAGTLLLLRWFARMPVGKPAPALATANQVLNAASLALVVLPLYGIGQFAWQSAAQSTHRPVDGRSAALSVPAQESAEPNIYYIVLDGYSRADVMQDIYGLDITPFMDSLRALGFHLPECAQSNYGLTPFSVFSALNMNYVDAPGYDIPLGSLANEVDTVPFAEYLRSNEARRFLAGHGYQFVAFETGFWWLDMEDADFYIVGNDNPLARYTESYEAAHFETIFLRTTALRPLVELAGSRGEASDPAANDLLRRLYDRNVFALDQLERVPLIPGKKFVYFHLMAPHEPFVFDAEGNFVAYDRRDGVIPAYPDEVTYLNRRMLEIIRALLAAEETPPVIILQSDHGWDPRYRMRILQALYLPGFDASQIPADHTPVNTFRLIFNHYFGADYPLLENRSYFSIDGEFPEHGIESFPYRLTPVPTTCMEP